MKTLSKRLIAVFLALITVLSLLISVSAEESSADITILFTHDLHSHLLPSDGEDGGQFGGYARLMTVINEQKVKYPDAVLVDGGDFSMGSLFQTAFATSALELRIMGAMDYDATTFGNHEYDYLQKGLISMLNTAAECGETVPAIVEANYDPPKEGEEGYDANMWNALENYGVKDYIILERGGIYYVIFGIFGIDSDDCAPNSGMILEDPIATAQATVDAATKDCLDTYGAEPVVICLSHSGTSDGKGEDYDLASGTTGIDVIISAHTHTTLEEPITVGDTHIVSAGEYGKYLGVVNLSFSSDGNAELKSYELIPIDENVEEEPTISALVEEYKTNVENDYLSDYGVTFDEVLVNNSIKFDSVDEVYATQHESTLGNVFSDAYKKAAEDALGFEVDVALTAAGVIRETIPMGDVTVSDVFNAASLGVGTEGQLIEIYVTGADLKNVLEVDASVQPLMSGAQLFFSGVEYSYNTSRMIFNKVDSAMLRKNDGTLEEIDDDKLYCVVTGMYAGQMLGSVKESSFGLLSITPRDAEGNPLTQDQFAEHVIHDENGNPVKEWYAIASYLKDMGGETDEKYAETDGRKVVYSSLNPVKLLKNANKFTFILIAVIAVLIAIIVLVIVAIVKSAKKRKTKKSAGEEGNK